MSLQDIRELPKAISKPTIRKRKAQISEILISTPFKDSFSQQQTSKQPKKVIKTKGLDELIAQFPHPATPLSSDPTEAEVPNLVCGDTFGHSRSGGQRVLCNMCEQWAH